MTAQYYFYGGFDKPQPINLEDITIEVKSKGDITGDMWELHNEYVNSNNSEYNEMLGLEYGIWRDPTIEELQQANRFYGLDENAFLEDFHSQN